MSSITTTRSRLTYIIGTAILVLTVISLQAFSLVTGRSLGLRSFITYRIQSTLYLPRAVFDSGNVQAHSYGKLTNIIFLHQSPIFWIWSGTVQAILLQI